MKKEWLVKTLALGIVVLFVGVVFQPGISAVDKETNEYDELKDSNEIKITDDYEEIITFIKGWAWINWIERRGLFRGEVNLTWGNYQWGFINLSGFRRSESGIQYYNELVGVEFVYAYHFVGFSTRYVFPEFAPRVIGIAFGNIEWS